MRYARIENQQVVEVGNFDSIEGRFSPSLVWIECPLEVVANFDTPWGWNGAEFTEPVPLSDEVIAEVIRSDRDMLLTRTDWQALSDVTMSSEMRTYRQALRDIPEQDGFPNTITWPTAPE